MSRRGPTPLAECLSLTCACLLASASPCRLRAPASSSPTLNCENFCVIPSRRSHLATRDPRPDAEWQAEGGENHPQGCVNRTTKKHPTSLQTHLPSPPAFSFFSASTLVSALLSLSGLGWAGLSNEASAEFHAVDRRIQLVLDSRPRMDNSCWEHRDDSSSPASRQCSAPFASRCEQVVVRVKRTESTERIYNFMCCTLFCFTAAVRRRH